MKKCSFILALAGCLAACANQKGQDTKASVGEVVDKTSTVPYTVAERYFSNNGIDSLNNPKIESESDFKKIFGAAAVMGPNGKPTTIDFSKQYVIAVVKPTTAKQTTLTPVSLKKIGDNVEFTYKVEIGDQQSFTSKPSLAIIVDKNYDGTVKVVEQ